MQSTITFVNGTLQFRKPFQDELDSDPQESAESADPEPRLPLHSAPRIEGTAWDILLQKCKPAPIVLKSRWQPPAGSMCYFMSIPAEIRLKIYRSLLISRHHALLHKCKEGFRLVNRESWDCPLGIHPQILRTCRQINQEATPILYSQNLFQRGYKWPCDYTDSGTRVRRRLSDTSPVSQANLASISRICLSREYKEWLRDGKPVILDEFLDLKELQIAIDFNEVLEMELGSFQGFTEDTIRAIHRERPDMPCFKMEIRLSFRGQDYDNWGREYTPGKESFSIHLIKKAEMQAWMQQEGLFSGRFLSWSFETLRSQYCGPSCYISFSCDQSRQKARYIKCDVCGDDTDAFGLLDIDSEEKEISVDIAR